MWGRFCLAVGGFERQTDLSRFLVSPHGDLGPGRSRHRRRPRCPLPDDADDLRVREQDHRDGDDVLKRIILDEPESTTLIESYRTDLCCISLSHLDINLSEARTDLHSSTFLGKLQCQSLSLLAVLLTH